MADNNVTHLVCGYFVVYYSCLFTLSYKISTWRTELWLLNSNPNCTSIWFTYLLSWLSVCFSLVASSGIELIRDQLQWRSTDHPQIPGGQDPRPPPGRRPSPVDHYRQGGRGHGPSTHVQSTVSHQRAPSSCHPTYSLTTSLQHLEYSGTWE